jgi:D-cysteine desulfhydrase
MRIMSNHLERAFPQLASRLGHLSLAELPTPVSAGELSVRGRIAPVLIKRDDITGSAYGGNKIRKLEYVLHQAREKGAKRIATFGTVGSHHAIATALYSKRCGFKCTCFLSHQHRIDGIDEALRFHLLNGTEIVRYGGNRSERVALLRKMLHGRGAWVVPLGGSSWQGTLGYVNAGLELAEQIARGEFHRPARIYLPFGTMGTAAGLALGLALANVDTDVHAVRVSDLIYASEAGLKHLLLKTHAMMRRLDPAIPKDLPERARITCRHEFFGGGYARSSPQTDSAMRQANDELGLHLEATYTGKAMAALLSDAEQGFAEPVMFWHSYNSQAMPAAGHEELDWERLPADFRRYTSAAMS